MLEAIMENLIQILGALLMTLIGVFGAWLSGRIARRTELGNVQMAQQEVIRLARLTVGELQQTLVEGLKAAHADGRLSREEIAMLGRELLEKTMEKLSRPTRELLNAAGVDIIALIHGAGEDWIASRQA